MISQLDAIYLDYNSKKDPHIQGMVDMRICEVQIAAFGLLIAALAECDEHVIFDIFLGVIFREEETLCVEFELLVG